MHGTTRKRNSKFQELLRPGGTLSSAPRRRRDGEAKLVCLLRLVIIMWLSKSMQGYVRGDVSQDDVQHALPRTRPTTDEKKSQTLFRPPYVS